MNYWVYKKDLNFQNSWEEVREIENCLVNNKKLIVKKGQEKEYKAKFVELIDKVAKEANKKDIIHSAALVFPSYAMIPYAEIVLSLLCLSFGYNITSFQLLSNIFSQEKKFFDRLKDYSYYFSAKERLNLLFAQKEKNEKQKNIILKEKVNRISLQNLSFSYDSNNKVLQKVDLVFEKGKINHLTGKNGFGKSTIIDLIMGVIKPDQGKIIINDHYDLQEINLTQ
jgi:ABC-type multidrug transport system fused ATPase/permease subunit